MRRAVIVLWLVACHAQPRVRPHLALDSTAERSHWQRTGRYDEAVQLCRDFARAYDGVTCVELGRTLEDRPIVAVHIARSAAHRTVYVQAGIHAGEIEGKDAGFWFLRDLLDGKVAPGALAAVDVVFVPCINPDGHERFGPNNRPNQRGPAEMGFRTNAAHMNLNRDYVKSDTPELQAALAVIRARDPLMLVDLHTTDGAKFQHDISINLAPIASRPDPLDDTANAISIALAARLTALGHLPVEFYPSFVTEDDPASGFAIGEAPPRFSQMYSATRSRLGILVETHSWRTYPERIASTYHALQGLFELAARDAPAWAAASDAARAADQQLRGHELTLVWDNGPHTSELAFRGYAYTKEPSELSGGTWIRYDETKPELWKIPLHDELVSKVSVHVPAEGYIIDGGFAALVAPVLARHGIRFTRIPGQPRLEVATYRATKVAFKPPYEGRARVELAGVWAPETRTLDRGAIFVSLRQPIVRLIVHLLDPDGPDSLAAWGFVTPAFENKEYMESYVAEEAARAMLARDPALRAQFDAALAADPELAHSPELRLEWFYRRHPAWDERLNLLPIYRVDREPPVSN